jgi:hypothetical protein
MEGLKREEREGLEREERRDWRERRGRNWRERKGRDKGGQWVNSIKAHCMHVRKFLDETHYSIQ